MIQPALNIYTNILQLRTETFEWLKRSPSAVPFAISMFFVVTLLAGCGKWLALPGEMRQPLLSEYVDLVDQGVDAISASALPALEESLEAISQDKLSVQPLQGIPTSTAGFQELLAQLALSPEQVEAYTLQFGLSPERVDELQANISAWPDQSSDILEATSQTLENLQPPLGTRFSRFLTLFGRWLSTPFQLMAAFLPLALVALLAAKVLGGKGTLSQHLVAVAIAVAPAILLFFVLPPDLSRTFSITVALALTFLGRMLAIVTLVWAVAILLKSLSIAHEFSVWRAGATLVLTYAVIYVVLPLLGVATLGYLIRG